MEKLIEELTKVNPEQLSKEGLKLFEKINEIIDKNKELESALNNSVSKDKIKEILLNKIKYRQFELQQEYKDFKDDIELNTLQDVLELLNKGE